MQSRLDRFEGQYELQGVIEESPRAKAFVPGRGSLVLCVYRQRDSTNFLSHR